jgi:competence protein ComFC
LRRFNDTQSMWTKLGHTSQLFVQHARRLLAPEGEHCLVCGAQSVAASSSLPICRSCSEDIPWIAPQDIKCSTCGRSEFCPDCPRRSDASFIVNRSAVRYTETMKSWLSQYKYRGDERLHTLMAGMMRGALDRLLLDQGLDRRRHPICLSYVPLSAVRLSERGFNQTELVACALSKICRIPVLPTLERIRHTGKQSYKTRSERLGDLNGAFAVSPEIVFCTEVLSQPPPSIILIDDVYTTGSTLDECALTLSNGFNCSVYGLTWAR